MPELKDKMYLYHGSYCEVSKPDLSKCAGFKDFGGGFYLTSSEKQAQDFAKISTKDNCDVLSKTPQSPITIFLMKNTLKKPYHPLGYYPNNLSFISFISATTPRKRTVIKKISITLKYKPFIAKCNAKVILCGHTGKKNERNLHKT